MNDGFLLVMSYFPTTGRRVFFVKAQRFADFGSEEAVAAPLAGGGEGTVGSVPGVACQREFSAVSGKDGSGPYVFSGLRRFFRQQMDAVPLLVVLAVLHDGVDGFEALERLLKTLYTLRAGESQGPCP